jgi:cobyrinic acid a,c-diamide synthase
MVTAAIEQHVGLPVVGALGRAETLHLPERHLGLIPTTEPGRWQAWLEQARALVTEQVDLDRVLELAREAGDARSGGVEDARRRGGEEAKMPPASPPHASSPIIAVAQDAAFSFLYEDNLDLLREAGAELVPFSPLRDAALPPGTQALYLCGGFPELYAAELAGNATMREQIRQAAATGMPIYAECGGLMYLTTELHDAEGHTFPMVGVLPGRSQMTPRLTLGYRTIEAHGANWLLQPGETLRGHEFHYSTWERDAPDPPPAYTILADEWRREACPDGALIGNVLASYVHLHFLAHPDLAARFVAAARGH